MLKTDRELEFRTPITIECCFDDDNVILLHGSVVHSTGTLGGFKTGIQLSFPETEDRTGCAHSFDETKADDPG